MRLLFFPRRLAAYLGAQHAPAWLENEWERSLQRGALTLVLPVLLLLGLSFAPTTVAPGAWLFVQWALPFGAVNLLYMLVLKHEPRRAHGLQYLMMVCDGVMPSLAAVSNTRWLSWSVVMLLVIPARCGLRYGVRTFWFQWVFTAAETAFVFAFTGYAWGDTEGVILCLVLLLITPPLFLPMFRANRRLEQFYRERSRLETAADQMASKSAFLSKIGHELRSPLQMILTNLDLFEVSNRRPEDIKFANELRRSSERINRHLEDLLVLARSESGNLVMRPKLVDVRALFEGVVRDADKAAKTKGLTLNFSPPEGDLRVYVDGVRLGQVLENLVTNAIKYTKVGGVVVVLQPFEPAKRKLLFQVQDTGRGIPEDLQDAIFAPFEQGRGDGFGRESVGLGLAVVRVVLAHMGGRVKVNSSVDNGSVFEVQVPVAVAAQTSRSAVLIVDDQDDILASLEEGARHLGFSVVTASTAGQACNLLAAQDFAVVLCDLNMPVISGQRLATEIKRAAGRNAQSRWVAMTAGATTEGPQTQAFDELVRKPISLRMLKQVLGDPNPPAAPT